MSLWSERVLRFLTPSLTATALVATSFVVMPSLPALASGDLGWNSEVDYTVDFNGIAHAENSGQVVPSTGDFTIEAWVRPDNFKDWNHIVDQGLGGQSISYLKINAAGEFVTYLAGSPSVEMLCGKVVLDAWNHVALTLSGTTMRCYLDGVERKSQTLTSVTSLVPGFRVGAYEDSDGLFHRFDGEIDQVKVWSGALSEGELQASMHSLGSTDFAGNLVANESLIAHYDFNEGGGTTIYDRVGSSHLTVTGPFTFRDVKRTTFSGSKTYVAFPRTYLPGKKGWVPSAGVTSVDALIVAGGGGGGAWIGGGGGAGGFFEQSQTLTPGATVQVLIGQGGAGAQFQDADGDDHLNANLVVYNTNGQNSQLGSTSVPGGGAGGFYLRQNSIVAQPGGSGGGGIGNLIDPAFMAGGAGIAGFGTDGGDGWNDGAQPHATGGGGGAGGAIFGLGPDAIAADKSGSGGYGKTPTLIALSRPIATELGVGESTSETDVFFASGGAGSLHGREGVSGYTAAQGLDGGGGDGTVVNGTYPASIAAQSGMPNTGGGGGGAGNLNTKISIGGNGGSGVVVLSYLNTPEINSVTPGVTSLTVNWADQGGAASGITAYRVDYADASSFEATFASDPTVSPAWLTASSSISPSATSYTVTGLNPDKKWFVRLAAVTAGGVGEFAYPWQKIFETTTPTRVSGQISYASGYGLSGNNTDLNRTDFSRVRYRMEATYGGTDWYADTHFDKALSDQNSDAIVEHYNNLYRLQVPVPTGGTNSQFEIHGTVSDLSVTSNSPLVANGSGLTGRLEIWPWNYSASPASGLVGGSLDASKYDDGDSFPTSGNLGDHGSFQLHNIGSSAGTILAWNNPRITPEIGFGSQPFTGLARWHPDWTFSAEAGNTLYPPRTNFSYEAFANLAHQPLDDYSLSLTGNATAGAKIGSPSSPVNVIPVDISFTWEAWIKPENKRTPETVNSSFYTILDNAEEGNNYGRTWLYVIDAGSGPYLSGGYYREATPEQGTAAGSAPGVVEYSKWQHVAMSVDRGSASGSCSSDGVIVLRLYVNGVEVGSRQDNTGFSGCPTSAGLSIGQNGDFTSSGDLSQFFKGEIDQVKVWEGALSPSQIQSSMQSFGAGSVTNTLRAHYSFNELTSSPVDGDMVTNLAATGSQYDLNLDSNAAANVAANVTRSSNSFSLSYNGNTQDSGSIDPVSGIRPYADLSVASEGNLAKANFSFANWDTKSGGTGAEYNPGDNYVFTYGDQTLFAEWERSSYNVTYQAGSRSGVTGANQVALKLIGQDLVLADEDTANSWFDRPGYKVIGWSTADDYTVEYAFGASYNIDADLNLYPVWGIDEIVATWDTYVNAGSSTSNSNFGNLPSMIIKSGNSLDTITRVIYLKFDFDSDATWNSAALELTVADQFPGGGINQEYSLDNFAVSIFARDNISDDWNSETSITWNNAPHLSTATHPPAFAGSTKIGDFNVPTSDENGKITGGGGKYIISNSQLRDFLNSSDGEVYFFLVRTDLARGDNLSFASKENGTFDAPTLRPLSSSDSFLVTYDLNGGSGTAPSNQVFDGVTPIAIADGSSFVKGSEVFIEWNTERDGSGQRFNSGATYSVNSTLALYAIYGLTQQTVSPSLSYSDTVYSPSGSVSPNIVSAGHNGAKSFTRSTSATCDVDASTGVVTIKQAGSCSVQVSFAETTGYAAATASATFEITKANQSPLIWDQSKISYDYLGTLDLSTAVSGGTVSLTNNLTFVASQGSSCQATGSVISGGAAGSVCSVTVTLAGDVNYEPISLTQVITVNKINQSALAIVNPGSLTFGDSVQLSATGGSGTGALTFSTASAAVCTVTTSGLLEVIGVGDCVVTVDKALDTNYNAVSGSRTITTAKATHTVSFTSTVPANPIVNDDYQVTGVSSTGDSALAPTFSIAAASASICEIAGNTVTFKLDGVCEIEASRAATANYEAAATVTQRIVVGQANQSITFANIADKPFGAPAFTLSGTSTSGNTVTFATGPGTTNSACSVTSAGLVVVAAVGTCEVVANSASGNGYAAASSVSRTFEISAVQAGRPFITAVSFGDQTLTATYFAPSYLGGGTISGYRLQAFDAADNLVATQTSCATSGTLSCTVTGLTNGTNYTLKIAAITEAGVGLESSESVAVAPAANPEAVTALTAVQGDQKLTISWRAPSNLGGGTFDSFRIFVREAGGSYPSSPDDTLFSPEVAASTVNGVTTVELTGLTNGQAYDVRVVTVTQANTAQLTSNTAEVTQTPYTVPDAPPSVTVLEVGDDIVITWSQPVFDGGSAVSGFSVLLDSVAATCSATSATSCTIPKSTLTPGTTVDIEVKAQNDAGPSAPATTQFAVAALATVTTPGQSTVPGAQGPAAGLEALSGQARAWTKRISPTQVRVYIKFPEMGSNYQVNLQRNDGAYVRVMSKTINTTADTDLRVVGDWYYLVKTIDIEDAGRYRIEVTQDNERMPLNGRDRPAVYSVR